MASVLQSFANTALSLFELHSNMGESPFGLCTYSDNLAIDYYNITKNITKSPIYERPSNYCPDLADHSPMTISGAFGKYADVINGQYYPTLCTIVSETNIQLQKIQYEVIYQKFDQTNIRIQYCSRWRAWKLVGKDGYTIAQMKSIVSNIPLDQLTKIYWETTMGDGGPFELQVDIRLSLL
jgi:hypothetical protein